MTTDANASDVITEFDDGQTETTPPESTESSPVTAAEQDNQPNADEDNVQKRINKLTAEKYEAKRAKEALEAENQRLKDLALQPQEKSTEPALTEPVMPDDVFDETAMKQYHKEQAAYTAKIAQKQAQDAAMKALQDNQQKAQQAQLQQQQSQTLRKYVENGLADGLTTDDIQRNEQVIASSGMKAEVGNYIMQDENAAKIADYLAKNPAELHELNALDPMTAAVKVASEIKVRALGSGNVTKAPDPVKPLEGGGAVPSDDDEVPGLVIV